MNKLKKIGAFLLYLYKKIRIRKTYWTIAVPLILFVIGEASKLSEPLVKWIEALSQDVENGFLKSVLKVLSVYLSLEIPSWVLVLAIFIFLIISIIKFGEIFNPALRKYLRERINEIKSDIRNGVFYTGFGEIDGFRGLGRFNDSLALSENVPDLAEVSFRDGVNFIQSNVTLLEEIFGEMIDGIENTKNKNKLGHAYFQVRGGVLSETVLRVNAYLDRYFEDEKDSQGRIGVLVGWGDDLLSVYSKTINLKNYI